MAKQSHNRTDREHRTAMGQLGLKFHTVFLCASPKEGV